MNLISKIEINYFRSIYSITLNKVNDVNIFVGGNDAGKSNILRALNLFFNGKTDLNTDYNFLQDITKYRVEEAREAKGRVTCWIKITFHNIDNWRSLPNSFYIKKSWDRNGDVSLAFPSEISQRDLSRFLNKIKFHYVPAIRSRDIFSYYLGMVHDCLLNNHEVGLTDSSRNLTEAINVAIEDMSENIKAQLGFDSKIEVPQNFKDLFEALDFSTKFGVYDIPLQKRGDGIQARHIPFILDFIAKQDHKHHIWAYEEPENSLEMSNAFKLADQFKNKFSKENQIFLTTHSPAFYDLQTKNVSKWLVNSNQHKDTEHYASSTIEIVHEDNNPDERLGIAELVKKRAKEVFLANESLLANNLKLEKIISEQDKPILITEGKFDVLIIQTAWLKLYPDETQPFNVISCDISDDEHASQAGVKQLHSYLDSLLPNDQRLQIGIFDRDEVGRHYFNNLKMYIPHNENRKHQHNKSYAVLLPKPTNDNDEFWPTNNICIEFLFKKEFLTADFVKTNVIGFNGDILSDNQAEQVLANFDNDSFDDFGYFSKSYEIKKGRRKRLFAENKVPDFPRRAFLEFEPFFNNIKNIINSEID